MGRINVTSSIFAGLSPNINAMTMMMIMIMIMTMPMVMMMIMLKMLVINRFVNEYGDSASFAPK